MLDIKASGELQHVERADEIGIDIGARIFKAVTDTRLGGEMDDDFRFRCLRGSFQRIRIFQHADLGPEAVGAGKNGVAFFLEADIVIFRHAVEAGHEMAGVQQPFRNVKADEASRTGNQITHDDYIPNPLVRFRSDRSAENLLMKLKKRNLYAPSCGRPTAA
ncbi:hypothetical protein D3C87_1099280 [compost metagenome]